MPTSTCSSSQAESYVAELAEPGGEASRDDVDAHADPNQALSTELEAARAELAAVCAEKDAAEAAAQQPATS